MTNNKFERFFNIISYIVFSALLLLVVLGMFYGSYKLGENSLEFIITTSFVLAGFTFFALFSKTDKKFLWWVAQSCHSFVIAGSFLLSHLMISKIVEYAGTSNVLNIIIKSDVIIQPVGFIAFIIGITILVITVYLKANSLTYKKPKKKGKKK